MTKIISDYFYVVGDYSIGRKKENGNIVSKFNLDNCELNDTITIGEQNDTIRQIFFDVNTNQIYATGNLYR